MPFIHPAQFLALYYYYPCTCSMGKLHLLWLPCLGRPCHDLSHGFAMRLRLQRTPGNLLLANKSQGAMMQRWEGGEVKMTNWYDEYREVKKKTPSNQTMATCLRAVQCLCRHRRANLRLRSRSPSRGVCSSREKYRGPYASGWIQGIVVEVVSDEFVSALYKNRYKTNVLITLMTQLGQISYGTSETALGIEIPKRRVYYKSIVGEKRAV
ncbi:hypothetical protein F5Y04DRAFT_78830 [Hypomontagnella monticulosa]|nr:hypothetical protein F5Y04DRAFT_78830 [Hypomontagnella monticulosa]